jgi:hypothetical protein
VLQGSTLDRPRLRPGVACEIEDGGAILRYRHQGCRVEFPGGADGEGRTLLGLLAEGGLTAAELGARCPSLADALPDMLAQLDTLGLLTETRFQAPAGVVSGRQFYRIIRRFAERMKRRAVRSSYYQALVEGRVSRDQLIGYVLEYYHVVKLGPQLLAPAVAQVEQRWVRKRLQSFLADEIGHDEMIASSLAAVGFSAADLDILQPLPTTFAVCASLGALARQHPLSFKASVFLFEDPFEEFNQAFASRSRALDLPEQFYEPVLRHSSINEEGEHDEISAVLLDKVAAVSEEEQRVVKINLGCMLESMARQDSEVLEYYAKQGSIRSRLFA